MEHWKVGLCPTFLAEQFPHKQTAATQTAFPVSVAVLFDQRRHRGQVIFRLHVLLILPQLFRDFLRQMFYRGFILFLRLPLLFAAIIVVVLAIVIVISIDELLVVFTGLYLASIAFLSKGEV